ncbi:hypothetical protein MRX96_031731 [Rhipicephalus microplus]
MVQVAHGFCGPHQWLPSFCVGGRRDYPSRKIWSREYHSGQRWMPATVVSTSGARMVTLETPEGPQRRHVDQLRPCLVSGSSPNKWSQVNNEAQGFPSRQTLVKIRAPEKSTLKPKTNNRYDVRRASGNHRIVSHTRA